MLPVLFAAALAVTPSTATIQGVVRAERALEPIPFAVITIRELDRRVQTDAHGFFVLCGIPAGRWRVESSALGYEANALTVVTADNGTVRLDFELRLQPVQLPGVLVRTDARDAEFVPPPDPGPAAVRMSALSLKTIPGLAEPDILRGLQVLPSVAAMSDFSTALYVRGGAADQNLLQLDGIPLFNPYHVGGIFSAVPADAVSTVDVWAGALPARFGDRLSSVIVINTREGGKDHVRTSGGIGLLSANATVEGPIRGGRGSFLVSGRRTYIDAITNIAYGLRMIDYAVPYGFTDIYAKVTHRVGTAGSLAISGYWDGERIWSPERMRSEYDDFGELAWGSALTSLTYRQPIGGSLLLEARAGYSDFRGTFDGWGIEIEGIYDCGPNGCTSTVTDVDTVRLLRAHTDTRDIVAGADLTWFRRRHTLRGGLRLDRYLFGHAVTTLDNADEYVLPLFDQRTSFTTIGAYIEDDWQPVDRLGIRPGVRLLGAGRLGTALLPRIGARWQGTALARPAVIVLVLLSGCGDDPVGPITRADITRSFAATTFTARTGATTIDLLAQGGSLDITLRKDSTTTGRLFVPGGGEGGSDFDADLAGTFSFDDSSNEVTFKHPADTFVRDVTFTAKRSRGAVQLEAEDTFSGTTVRVVLR